MLMGNFAKGALLSSLLCSLPVMAWVHNEVIPTIAFCTEGPIPEDKEQEVRAVMRWFENGLGVGVRCDDTEGWQPVLLKYRGYSSMKFEKKQYGITVIDEFGDNKKIKMGSLPKGSKWAFRTPYVDRTYIRDALTFELGRRLGAQRDEPYGAPRTAFVEISVNNDFRGLFTMAEKIQGGPDRVPIKKIKKDDLKHMTYLLQISARDDSFKSEYGTMIKYGDPTAGKMQGLKEKDFLQFELVKNFMREEVNAFENALRSDAFKDPEIGYRSHIDLASFVDFFLLQELTKNIDGFRRNGYFYKGKDGKFHMGPLWDFDIAWGNLNFYGMSSTKGWSHQKFWLVYPAAFWFKRLLRDPFFKEAVRERYFELRAPGQLFAWDSLNTEIDAMVTELGGAPKRDEQRWEGTRNFAQSFVMNTAERSKTFEGNILILKRWLEKRLRWLDDKMKTGDFK